ncbi:hypothetical protein U3516DRAFT_772980 [Neocallimastix sp. 'constans']
MEVQLHLVFSKIRWRIRYIKSLEKLLIANSSFLIKRFKIISESNIYSISEEEDNHAVTEIQEDTKGIFIHNQFPKHLGYDCPFETPESKEVDHDKNNLFITLTLTGSTLDDNNLESINGYDPQHKLEFLGLNTLNLRHGKLKEYYIFQDYKSLIAHTVPNLMLLFNYFCFT